MTYKGWPLYLFKGDTKNGVANGQDVDLTGGYWYVMSSVRSGDQAQADDGRWLYHYHD